jgi:Flp pilus assembly protein TadG
VLDKKGQALVEFVIILPILIMLLFGIIDFGKIILVKMNLESEITEVTKMVNDNKSEIEIGAYLLANTNKINLNIIKNKRNTTILLTSKVQIITPGLNMALNSPYEVKVSRVIYNEQ